MKAQAKPAQTGHLLLSGSSVSGYQKGGIVVDGAGSTATIGNAVNDDEPVPIYDQYTAFDTTKLNNWLSYGVAAKTALPTCTFQP